MAQPVAQSAPITIAPDRLPGTAGILEVLAQRVRLARAQRGMTRKQLASQSGISLAYLARIESGTGNISLGLLQQLALALNLPLGALVSADEDQGAELQLVVEFLKRLSVDELRRVRRQLVNDADDANRNSAKRIALVGLRGAGKSSVGPRLADRLKVPFVELNREAEREVGVAVSEIITLYGQGFYRQLERRCLERVMKAHGALVLATAGGIVAEAATYELLLSRFKTIWLHSSTDAYFTRVMAQHDARIASPDLRAEAIDNIERTMEARRPQYALADISLDTTELTIEEVVVRLISALESQAFDPAPMARAKND
jgi:XRE family transcriptional regulator, aerobic/anaerobic benzoate catabolism transcriptional regulator